MGNGSAIRCGGSLDPAEGVATSVTLGLASVDAVLDRLNRWWLQLPATG